ncbi:MAG: hypothetical protein LBG93_07270 [Treponema sp.]|nr:hypothetical protein [Treponema sp.]
MKRFKLWKVAAPLVAVMMVLSCATTQPGATLDTPTDLVLNRGHIDVLSFGGPMGLSWGEVAGRDTFSVFVFTDAASTNPDVVFDQVEGINALYLNVNTAFADLSGGPFWFRVQAVSGEGFSALSAPMGPFRYAVHSDEFAFDAQGSYAIFANPAIPVIMLDTRRLVEREAQGHVAGSAHVNWPNLLATEEGESHALFQDRVLATWEDFIANELTPAQRASLNPALGYKDIHMFLYCGTASRTVPAARSVSTLGFVNVYNVGGFVANPRLRDVFPIVGAP